MLKHIFHAKHIFDPCMEIKIIFLHILKYNIKKKFILQNLHEFPLLCKSTQNIKEFNLKNLLLT